MHIVAVLMLATLATAQRPESSRPTRPLAEFSLVATSVEDWKPAYPGDRLLLYRPTIALQNRRLTLPEQIRNVPGVQQAHPAHGLALRMWMDPEEPTFQKSEVAQALEANGYTLVALWDPTVTPIGSIRALESKLKPDAESLAADSVRFWRDSEVTLRRQYLRAVRAMARHVALPEQSMVRYAADPRFREVQELVDVQLRIEGVLGFATEVPGVELDEWSMLQSAHMSAVAVRDARHSAEQMRKMRWQAVRTKPSEARAAARKELRRAFAFQWHVWTQIAEDAQNNVERLAKRGRIQAQNHPDRAPDPRRTRLRVRYENLREFARLAAEIAQLLTVPPY